LYLFCHLILAASTRFGYSSSGALSIDGFAPLLNAPPTTPIAPAYLVKCSAHKLDNKNLFGKSGKYKQRHSKYWCEFFFLLGFGFFLSDPFFEIISQPIGAPLPIKLHRSEVITKNTDPAWVAFQLPTAPLGGWDTLFTVRCCDWDANGAHQLIGECKISLREISLGSVQLALINPDKQGRYVWAWITETIDLN
jgi:C2 domain